MMKKMLNIFNKKNSRKIISLLGLVLLMCISFEARAEGPEDFAYCSSRDQYPVPVAFSDTEKDKELRKDFEAAKKEFLEACKKIEKAGAKTSWTIWDKRDTYVQESRESLYGLPLDLQKEFINAQKKYKETYSHLKLSKGIEVKKQNEEDAKSPKNKFIDDLATAGKTVSGGGGMAVNNAADALVGKEDAIAKQYANDQMDKNLTEEDLQKAKEAGLYNDFPKLSNATCRIEEMSKKYQSSCYSCIVVKTLLEKFMEACTKVYDLCSDIAVKILLVATLIWVAFWGLKTVSSLANVEPASMINTLLIQFFKIMFAYVVIMSGIDTFIIYIVNPILTAGADFGIAILDGAAQTLSVTPSKEYTYDGVSVLSADMLNKILGFTESMESIVSTNMVIGHALTCHATHAGAWVISLMVKIAIPNIWLLLCGALIWFAGFMLALSVCYYLLDISFKIGIAIMIFPIVMALWPFSLTSSKLKTCIGTILKSAAIFAFLAITTSYALTLISISLRDISELSSRIEAGDSKWISDTFDITGPFFIIILFAYFYSLKLISITISDYADQFFKGGLVDKATPMHNEMTRATDVAKKLALGAGGKVLNQAGKYGNKALGVVGDATIGQAVKFVKSQFKKKKDDDKGKPNEGTAVKKAGAAAENMGKATEATGKTVEATGKAASKGGSGMMATGKGLCGTGVGAIIGVPMIIAGAAVKGAGVATEYSGKAVAATGAAIKKSGKAMKKIGEKMEKAGRKVEKTGRRWNHGDEENSDSQNQNNN